MKRIFTAIITAALFLLLAACGSVEDHAVESETKENRVPVQQEPPSSPGGPVTAEQTASEALTADGSAITLTVGSQTFSATLLESESAHQLAARRSLTLEMSELNGNEKYVYLADTMPADAHQPGQINAGDLMLYGNNCLVLFYEIFSSSYSYTQLGSVDDPAGLAEALGVGGVTVTFSTGG